MGNPRACASSSRANVESPRMLIRSMGSICTATFKLMVAAARLCRAAGKRPRRRLIASKRLGPKPLNKCGLRSRARIERRDDVARPSPRHNEHRIEADFGGCVFGMTGEPSLGRRGDPAALAFAHRFRRILEPSAGFELDEDEDATAPRHDVDLSDR